MLFDESAGKAGDLYIRSVSFSVDGKLLATGAEDKQGRVIYYHAPSGQHVNDLSVTSVKIVLLNVASFVPQYSLQGTHFIRQTFASTPSRQ